MDASRQKAAHTAERVAAEIRRAIRHRDLLPGEHVVQNEWAHRLAVSSASTREALKVLVSEQLLSYEAHRGYFVARIDPSEMSQVYRIRQLLETEVLRSIRWPDPDELKLIRGFMDEVIDCARRGDGHGALEALRQVSFSVFDLSPLTVVVAETKRYWDRASVYRALHLVDDPDALETSRYYAEYVQMLETHDRDGLIALNFRHRADIPISLK